ncbi:hypothetical protein Pyn_20245 [Prunus yedoensis var. nudiflora]|uniref:Uncharacterized protein n=1 Tax=Prunus yedoensis var. nudiflora TaxID=2094558 RepID=A0A314UT18_PRUYE|nr:hypothetical protein Pyn_20245 [Prunus yedoensis var. nudiflora]
MIDWDRWLVKWHVEFLGRQWHFVGLATLAGLVYLHYLAVLALFYFTWLAFLVGGTLLYLRRWCDSIFPPEPLTQEFQAPKMA